MAASRDHQQRVAEVFAAALDCAPGEWAAFLDGACAADPALRSEVESLLHHHEHAAAGFLDPPEPPAATPPPLPADALDPLVGATVAGYRVLRVIGAGGMGTVYEAVQHQPHRTVALKVMHQHVASLAGIRRFQHEAEMLGRLRHPNIAQIYQAGMHTLGAVRVPFFALEYIAGARPVTRYAVDQGLDVRGRVRLFAKVCDAVQHGHQKAIIHRDLKPANILVDADGEPKVIDFGVARAMDTDLALTTRATSLGQIVGTVQYMSPEQCEADPQEIDTRSDVYSLGIVLYELLTGALPYSAAADNICAATRAIREQAPRPLSACNRQLHGAIETIVLKALEKDREQRYASAAALAQDLRHYLNREPLAARPLSAWRRARDCLARHPVAVRVAGVLCLIGLLTLAGLWWRHDRQYAQARRDALRLQNNLEIMGGQRVLSETAALWQRFPALPEAALVHAHALFDSSQQPGAEYLRSDVVMVLAGGYLHEPSHWAPRALLSEMFAIDGLQAAAERDMPDTAAAWYLRSFATLKLEDARQHARRAVDRAPPKPLQLLAWERLACLSARLGRAEEALAASRQLLALGGDRYRWSLFEADVLLRTRRYADARRQLDTVLATAPTGALAYRMRAACHLCLRDYPRAIDDYAQAAAHSPDRQPWTLYQGATPLWILGRTAEAAATYRNFLKRRPGSEYAIARLYLVLCDHADALARAGQTESSAAAREEARALLVAAHRPEPPVSWPSRILACLARELSPDQLVTAAAPGNTEQLCEACYYAGEACRVAGDPSAAQQWFSKCVETDLPFDPDNATPDPMNEYHLALWRLDQLRAAPDG